MEKLVLTKRRQLINEGKDVNKIKIRNFELFYDSNKIEITESNWLQTRPREFTIFYCNARSLINLEKRILLSNFITLKDYDFVCITETWLTDSISDSELFLLCYNVFRSDRECRSPGVSLHGGTLVLVKSCYNCNQLEISDLPSGSLTACCCTFDNSNLAILCCYSPPDNSPFAFNAEHIDSLTHTVTSMKMTHDNLIFCGDFNADIDWDDHSTSSLLGLALLDLMDESNLLQLIDFSTAVSGILDLFFVSENVDFIHINRIDDGINISNHYPIAGSFTMRNVLLMPRLVHRQNYFSYCKGDYDKLNRLIFESPFLRRCWSNVNVLVKEWEIWFKNFLPLAVHIRTRHRASLSPWISSNTSYHLKKLSTLKRKLPTSHSKVAVKELECVRLISRDKLEYQISLADNRNTNSLFKYYRSFNKSALPSKIHFNSLIAQGDSEQADLFANYFSSVYKVSTEFDPSSLSFESELPIVDNIIFEDSNVMQICNGLHVNKASGPDSLPASIYKQTSSSISKSLCQLFRKILQTSLYPTA